MNKTILTTYQSHELKELIQESLLEAFENLMPFNQLVGTEQQKPILTRKETAAILGISLPTLHYLTMRSKIKSFRIGHSIRYRLEDVYASLSQIKQGGVK
ncbi:helix-turn-helix domain-containing protein [Pedobacter sp.]